MPLVAGVDSSTQSTKIEIRDADSGELVAFGQAPHPVTLPPRSEQDPAAWWQAFELAWAAAGVPAVAAIAVGGQQHGMVALDADRQVIRPAKLWNDTESAPDAGWLLKQLDGRAQAWAEACGSVPVAAFTVTKLSWLHRSEPEAWNRLAHVVLPHDWMTLQLTGALVTDRGDASGTGYWSPTTGEYQWDLLGIVDSDRDWAAAVPRVLGPLEAAGIWRGAVVAPGTGDNMAGALGLGLRPGDVAISIGTSGTVYAVSETPTADPSGSIAGFADATGRYLPLACTLNATKVTESVRRLLGVDFAELERLAMAAPPGADGVVLLPYLGGERTPNRPGATGVWAGLRSDVSREQLARSAYEAVVCSLLDAYDALGRLCPLDGRVFLIGGGARSTVYRQLFANLLGRPVVVPDSEETVATGAAVQAAAVLAQQSPIEVAGRWGLGRGVAIEADAAPSSAADAAAVRAAYARLRDATDGW